MPHVDWTITPTSILAVCALIFGGIVAWRDHEWRVKNLEDWKSAHEHATVKALENITFLREIASKMEEMIRGQGRRLEMLENSAPNYRGPRAH